MKFSEMNRKEMHMMLNLESVLLYKEVKAGSVGKEKGEVIFSQMTKMKTKMAIKTFPLSKEDLRKPPNTQRKTISTWTVRLRKNFSRNFMEI